MFVMLFVLCALNPKVDCSGRLVCIKKFDQLTVLPEPFVHQTAADGRNSAEKDWVRLERRRSAAKRSIKRSAELKRAKRSDHHRGRGRAVRSCYCKLRSSFPATINEEKLDFVCNCRRHEHPILLFKQHRDTDNYLPTGSTRTAYRSRHYRTGARREPNRAKHGLYETLERRRRQRKPRRNRQPTPDDEIELPTKESSASEQIKEPNESYPNESANESANESVSERVCSCDSQGCVGNCEQLTGCVCSDRDRCWGSSCRSPLSSVNSLGPSFGSSQFGPQRSKDGSRAPQPELVDLVYVTKGRRKFKNVDEAYGPSESILSRINMAHQPFDRLYPMPYYRAPAMQPTHPAIFAQQPSQLTFKSLILGELENASQEQKGRCNCLPNGRCFGSECNNLKGCICDETSCYGRYCALFKNYFIEQLSASQVNNQLGSQLGGQVGSRPMDQHYDYRPTLAKSIRYRLNSQSNNPFSGLLEDKQPVENDLPKETFVKEHGRDYAAGRAHPSGREYSGGREYAGREHAGSREYAKESSKTLKCERINEEVSEVRPETNRTQTISLIRPNSEPNNDDKLNAYEMKVVKLTPISSSQYVDTRSELSSRTPNQLQNRADSNDNATLISATNLID